MNKSIFNIPNPKALASKIKLISFDLDGTLLGTSGKISSDSLKEIARIKKMGVAMAIATGRPLFSCEEIIDQVGVEGASMFFAGSLVIDVFTRIPVFENHLSKEVVKNLVKFSRSNKLSLELYTGEEYFVDQETDLIRAHAEHYLKVPPQVFDLDKLSKKERFLKAVISTVRGENTEKVTADFCKDLAASSVTPACGAVHPNVVFYNITSRWASRRRAFEGLLEYYELQADEIMSFGDAPADETFLKMSGIGIAMDNADPVAKEAANFITKSVEEDGIAQALRILYPLS